MCLCQCSKVCERSGPLQHSKGPEPQICPKFVPTIVCRVPMRGTRNCQKFAQKLEKRQFPDKFFNLWKIWQFWVRTHFGKFGVRGLFECCKGPECSQFRSQTEQMCVTLAYLCEWRNGGFRVPCACWLLHKNSLIVARHRRRCTMCMWHCIAVTVL